MPAASYTRCLSAFGSTSRLALQSRYPPTTRQGSVALLTGALCHDLTPLRAGPMFIFVLPVWLTDKEENIYHLLKLIEYLTFLSLMTPNRETLEEDPPGWCLFLLSSHIVKVSLKQVACFLSSLLPFPSWSFSFLPRSLFTVTRATALPAVARSVFAKTLRCGRLLELSPAPSKSNCTSPVVLLSACAHPCRLAAWDNSSKMAQVP